MTETSGNLALKKESASKFALPAIRTRFSSTGSACCIVVLRQERQFNSINLHLYHYAGNNPVRYTDPDGEAVVKKDYDGQYIIRSQDLFEKTVFEKIQEAAYSICGEQLTDLEYKIGGETRIKENPSSFKSKATDFSMSSISIAGDMKISSGITKLGKIISAISWGKTIGSIIQSFSKESINDTAIEGLSCMLLYDDMKSSSADVTTALYTQGKKAIGDLVTIGAISMEYDKLGNVNSYSINNQGALDLVKNELHNQKINMTLNGTDK